MVLDSVKVPVQCTEPLALLLTEVFGTDTETRAAVLRLLNDCLPDDYGHHAFTYYDIYIVYGSSGEEFYCTACLFDKVQPATAVARFTERLHKFLYKSYHATDKAKSR